MRTFVGRRVAGLLLIAITTTAWADERSAGTLCGFSPQEWSTNLAVAMEQRRGDPLPFTYWNLALAVSMLDLADRTNDGALRRYAESIVGRFVAADGSISGFPPQGFEHLQTIPTGQIFIRMYERTGDERYRKAALLVRESMHALPATANGVFAWRPHQVWLDGIWFSLPFYAQYGRRFGEPAIFDDIRRQYAAVFEHSRDPKTGLLHHGWDETHEQFWANPQTGTSSAVWSRAVGWYAMSLVDVLDEVPPRHPAHAYLIRLLTDIAQSVVRYQDRESGLWFEVIDQPAAPGNYLESSGTAMFVYALAKGVNQGYLDRRFSANAVRGYVGLIRDKVEKDEDGRWSLIDIVQSAGLGAPPEWPSGSPPPSPRDASPRGRDGSAQYYFEQPRVKDHSFGVAPFIRAGVEVESLMKKTHRSAQELGLEQLRCRSEPARPKPEIGTFGYDEDGMDRSVAPGDDFFRYAVGKWVDSTEIPPDRSSLGSVAIIREKATARVREIIERTVRTDAPEGSDVRKIGDYFASFMDEARMEQLGASPLKVELDAIAAIETHKDLSAALGASIRADVDVLNGPGNFATPRIMGLWVAEDLNDATHYRPYLMQGGLGMPDREYYLGSNPRYAELRTKYETHIANMLRLAGFTQAEARSKRVMALEMAIAKAHASVADTIDVSKGNTVWSRSELAQKAPGLDWTAFLTAAGMNDQPRFGAWQASAITGISKLTASQPLPAWKDYLLFHAIENAAPFLSKAFVDEHFAFNGRAVSGTPRQRERWKRGVDSTSAVLGEPIGKLYVEKYFPPEAKAKAQEMADHTLKAFAARLDRLDWMSPETKVQAKKKLANFRVMMGYPDRWRDYSGLQIVRGDAYGNWQRAASFEYRRNLAKLGQPVDRGEWFITPQTVNALFAPSQNCITLPAAILAPTFFDPNADAAVNYGALGGGLGHEVSHGFDDNGALFDADGNLRNWWTQADMDHFVAQSKKLVDQYSAYEPLAGLHINGQQTSSENIADVAGLATAWDAYQLSLNGKPAPVIDGFTPEQRFFLGWAQNFRAKFREDGLRRQIVTEVLAPTPYRALTVRNLDAWYSAFDVKPDQKLYLKPADRVKIW